MNEITFILFIKVLTKSSPASTGGETDSPLSEDWLFLEELAGLKILPLSAGKHGLSQVRRQL